MVYIYLLFCIYFQQQKHCDSNYGHSITHLLPVSVTSTRCWTHNQSNHDLFINYRSSSEGRRYPVSFAVCTVLLIDFCFCTNLFPFFHTKEYDFKFGIVQMIYDKLSVKRNRGIPLFIFRDKKCLCVGQDWEQGFLQGLMTSKVIILLMSNKVCVFFFSCFLLLLSDFCNVFRQWKTSSQKHPLNKTMYCWSILTFYQFSNYINTFLFENPKDTSVH